MTVLVATTLTHYAMADQDTWGAWLYTAEALRANAEAEGTGVEFFCAIEVDARGLAPFKPLTDRLGALGGSWWTYSLDNGRTTIDTAGRLLHITTGQNLCSAKAAEVGASHLLFMAADCCPPADAITKLTALDYPLVGGEVPTYCLSGPAVDGFPGAVVQAHMPTAAFVLIRRDVFTRLRWRVDGDLGMTDDPSYAYDAEHLLGIRPLVRKDCAGRHFPEAIGDISERYPGRDMSVQRQAGDL